MVIPARALTYNMQHVQTFWKDLLGWYQQFSKEELSVNLRTIILGWRTVDLPILDNYINYCLVPNPSSTNVRFPASYQH